MEDSWRLRSIQGTNICPTCSTSHFPFCPQPPPYDPSFHRPYFDPIPYNRGYRDFENDRALKRTRVGEMDPNPNLQISSENERRLSLIRNHGAQDSHLNGYSNANWQSKPPGLGPSFYDSRGGSVDRVSQILHQEPGFDARRGNGYGEKIQFGRMEYDLGYSEIERERMLYRKNEEGDKNSFFRSPYEHYSMNNDAAIGAPKYVSPLEEHQQTHTLHHEAYLSNRESFSVYRGNEINQVQAKGFNQANNVLHSNAVESPLSLGPGYEGKPNLHFHGLQNEARQSFEVNYPPSDVFQTSVAPRTLPMLEQLSAAEVNGQRSYMSPTGNRMDSFRQVPGPNSQGPSVYPPLPPLLPPAAVGVYPPLPPLPPPSLPMEPPGPPPAHLLTRISPPNIPLSSPDVTPFVHPPAIHGQSFPMRNPSPEKPKIIDASSLFKLPNRESRPDHIVVILRGLPGSGKSYVAKMLRDLEVENGANAPRIHSMDDYFMTEVEKVEESEGNKSSGSGRGKKRVTKKVMEYCYEPEMEEAYRASMLKAFKKTVEDGMFTFIIVDDRNLRVADFAQFWASAKRAGYEVYLLEALYKDPVGCAARNIHGFTTEDIQKMAELWEEAPSLYMRLDIQSLFHGDDLKGNEIQEVDMDMDDVASSEDQSELPNRVKTMERPSDNVDDSVKDEVRWDTEVDDPGVKELGRSKWSHDADEEDIKRSEQLNKVSNALSGLIQAYTKGDKSVHWGDQAGKTGFSIGASKRSNALSLVIGPGSGYNLKSNPLPEEENDGATDISWQSKKRSVFEEQLRAERASERESFKAVVDRRRQRIAGLAVDDEVH